MCVLFVCVYFVFCFMASWQPSCAGCVSNTHTLTHIPIKYVNCDICRFVVAISAAAIVVVVVVAVVVVAVVVVVVAAALTFNPNMSALSRSMHN